MSLVLSVIGVMIAGYLTMVHYSLNGIACNIDNNGCNPVLSSEYAVFMGIPIAILGLLYYLALSALMTYELFGEKYSMIKLFTLLTSIGVLISMYLVYIQAFIIEAFCYYCLGSALVTTLLLVLDILLIREFRET